MKDFRQQLFSGIYWTSIQMMVNRGFKFIIKLILARLLFPEDYGIVGMAVVFTSIISVFNEMGMGAALIQRKNENLNEDHFNTAFWSGLLWGIFLFLFIAFVIGPVAASFYDEPILKQIIPVLSLGVLATPVNVVHKAKITRDLNFKKISFISNTSNIFSGILALILAFNGFGVWSLVFNSVASFLIAMPQWFYATRWVPSFSFSKKAFKDVFGFGVYTTGTRLFIKINGQIDYLIIGKLLGATALGIYSLAFLLTSIMRSQITQVVDQVLYPLFSKLQDDPLKLKGYYLKILRANTFLVYPVMFGVILFSEDMVPILFGAKWTDAIPLLKILSIGVIISMITASSPILIRASGKPGLELRIMTINTICFYVPFITVGTLMYEVEGTAIGYVAAVIFSTIVVISILNKHFGIRLQDSFKAIKLPLIVSSVPFLLVLVLMLLDVHWLIGILAYLSLLLVMFKFLAKEEIEEIRKTLKEAKKGGNKPYDEEEQ